MRACRDRSCYSVEVPRPASVGETRRALPKEFIEILDTTFSQPLAQTILRGMGSRRLTTLRVNTLKSSAADLMSFFREHAVKHRRVPWYPDAFVLAELRERDAQSWAPYAEGRIYLQSLSSMIPALVLGPLPGESILDLAAAPGSKTTQMAAMMQNEGLIVANDIDPVRGERLAYNLRLQGCAMVEVRIGKGEKLGDEEEGRFDRVLVDVPCSGEGRFIVHEPATSRSWSPRTVTECVRLQKKLLASGTRAVKTGGVVVYSTCTLNREENEGVVQWGLENLPLEVEKVTVAIPGCYEGFARGRHPAVRGAIRILPDAEREGFFVCRMRKTGPARPTARGG
jgi:NOL1/NOP2/sun family putative RNA methylase